MKANASGYWPPNYDGAGLLNLISSVASACDAEAPAYPPLAGVDCSTWRRARNLVLILADGVGADFVARQAPGGFIQRHQIATLSSVCPTTTAAAIPTLMTGLPPAAHGLTGWHVYLDEIDSVTAVLPLSVRGLDLAGRPPIDPHALYAYPNLYGRLQCPSHVLSPIKIADSPFSRIHSAGASLHPYVPESTAWWSALAFGRRRREFFPSLRRLCHAPGGPRFIYAYWPDFDHAAHEHGVDSDAAVTLFRRFEAGFEAFVDGLRGSDTTVLLTADHGFIDSPSERQIHLDDHVAFAGMLAQPVCGERRLAYCYLKPGTDADFADYVKTVFGDRAEAWPRQKLLDEGWFGPGPAHPRLSARIGDYVLAMKDNWTLVDHLPDESPIRMIGVHGGLSRNEMLVPLCLVHA